MKIKRLVAIPALSLLWASLCASNVQAQACGRAFAEILVSDAAGQRVQRVTIELVAEAPYEEYKMLESQALAQGDPGDNPALSSPGHLTAIKVTKRDAEEIVRRSTPMDKTKDFCENPLKLQANTTVKVYGQGESKTRLGFCTSEGYERHAFLLKISAPGYMTGYYVGAYLGGCRRTYKIVLDKRGEGFE